MRGGRIGYFISEAYRGVKNNIRMAVSSVTAIAICLFLLTSTAIAYRVMTDTVQRETLKNQYLVFLDENISDQAAMSLQQNLMTIPNVATVTFISKEEAKHDFADFLDSEAINELTSDIFRHRYAVSFIDANDLPSTLAEIKMLTGVAEISGSPEVSEGFMQMQKTIKAIVFAVAIALLLISLLVIINGLSIGVQLRADDIFAMRLCGVSERYIRLPLFVEGIMIGLAGAAIAFGLISCAYIGIYGFLQTRGILEAIEMSSWGVYALDVGSFVFVGGIMLGIMAGIFAGKRRKSRRRTEGKGRHLVGYKENPIQ